MKAKLYPVYIFFTFLFLSCTNLCAQEAVQLKYDFKIGEKTEYKLKIEGDVTVEINTQAGEATTKNSAKMDGVFLYTHEIVKVDEENKSAQLNVVYGKSYMNTVVQNNIIPNKDLELLAGKTAKVTLNSKGEVKDYILPKDLPGSLQNADFRKMFVVFPEHKLRVGESWIKSEENVDNKNENFKITNIVQNTYTFLGVEKKKGYACAKVKLESNTSGITESKDTQIIVEGKVEGNSEGIIFYDLNNGRVIYSQINTKVFNNTKTQENKNSVPVVTNVDTVMTVITEIL
ncbi:MAG: DUF6263 family protein [Candidatus Omnitrophota bacterium]